MFFGFVASLCSGLLAPARRRRGLAGCVLAAVPLALLSLAPAASAAADPPTVGVRAGVHEDYSRLVFDWQDAVAYRVVEEPGGADIYFDRPAAFDLSQIEKKPPPLFKSVQAKRDGGTTVVHIVLSKGATLRHRLLGTRVVIDVFPATVAARADAAADLEKKIPIPIPIAKPAKFARPAVTPANKPIAEAEPEVQLGPAAAAAGAALAASLSGARVGNSNAAGAQPAAIEPRPKQ